MEKLLNDKDDPFVCLDEIEEDTAQTLEDNLAVLKKKFGDQIDADVTRMITLILPSKLLQVMGY